MLQQRVAWQSVVSHLPLTTNSLKGVNQMCQLSIQHFEFVFLTPAELLQHGAIFFLNYLGCPVLVAQFWTQF